MTVESHLVELERRHRAIDTEIFAELAHPAFDDLKLAELKKRKLRLKEEITKLRDGHGPH